MHNSHKTSLLELGRNHEHAVVLHQNCLLAATYESSQCREAITDILFHSSLHNKAYLQGFLHGKINFVLIRTLCVLKHENQKLAKRCFEEKRCLVTNLKHSNVHNFPFSNPNHAHFSVDKTKFIADNLKLIQHNNYRSKNLLTLQAREGNICTGHIQVR